MTRRQLGLLCLGIGLGVLVGVVAGHLVARDLRPAPAGPSRPAQNAAGAASVRTELGVLRRKLDDEIEARAALADEVAWLYEELWRLGAFPGRADAFRPGDEASNRAATRASGVEREADAGGAEFAEDPAGGERPSFDVDALVALGEQPAEMDDLRERWEEYQMERLALTHLSAVEGWPGRRRLRRELQALGQALREDLGEESYDLLLFATGQPNRIVVREVFDRSAANRAGFEPGDSILRYDGSRVFRPSELWRAEAAGRPGEIVRVEVLRGGSLVTLSVGRGPLGVLVRRARRAPASG